MPRRVVKCCTEESLVIFTGGAYEPDGDGFGGSVGAVIVGAGMVPEYFGGCIPGWLIEVWRGHGWEQCVGLAGLVAVLLAILVWRTLVRVVIVFIDSDPARHGLVRGYSPVVDSGGRNREHGGGGCRGTLGSRPTPARPTHRRDSFYTNWLDASELVGAIFRTISWATLADASV